MLIRYALCIAGGIGIGLYLAQNKLEEAHTEGYNKGYDEAESRYKEECDRCLQRDEELKSMSDQEFLAQPEVLAAAQKAVEAFEDYSGGVKVPPEALVTDLTAAVKLDAEIRETAKLLDEAEAVVAPEVREKVPEVIPEQASAPMNYNAVSTPAVAEPKEANDPVQTDVITSDEFIHSRTEHKQYSITYFSGDDTLAGERDQVIDLDARKVTLGDEVTAMLKAGPESWGGAESLFIRNHTQGVELEILWLPDKYSEKVTQAG